MALPIIGGIIAFGMGAFGLAGMAAPALTDKTAQITYNWFPIRTPPIPDLARMRYWEQIDKDKYIYLCRLNGFSEGYAEDYYENAQALWPIYDLISAWRRGKVTDADFTIEAKRLGWTGDRLESVKGASLYYPTPADLIRWQAKEVYEPDAIEKYGLKDEVDLLEREPFYKAGIDDTQIDNHWMAHWEHPAWAIVREMLFRTPFSEDDMKEWFRLVEIPPYWRDLFIRISYRTLTRVDIRRMHKLGVFTDDELPAIYETLGYNEVDRQRMADFTILYNKERPVTVEDEHRQLTRAQILEGYREAVYSRKEAQDRLQFIDYSELDADFLLLLEDIDLARKRIKLELDYLEEAMISGKLDDNEVAGLLTELQIPANQQEVLLAKWQRAKEKQVAIPSKDDFGRWLVASRISQIEYEAEMKRKGYSDHHIGLYVSELLEAMKAE